MAKGWRDAIFETEAVLSEIATKVPKDPSEEIYEFISLHREAYARLASAVTSGSKQKISAASGDELQLLERLITSEPRSPNGMAFWLTYLAAVAHSRGSEPFLNGADISNLLTVAKSGMEKIFWRL